MNRKIFWEKYELFQKKPFENFTKMEKLVKKQLDEEGLDFFKGKEIYTLGKFESTLPAFCKASEDKDWLVILMLSYVHLRDYKNASRIRKKLREQGMDKERPTWLDGIVDYRPTQNCFKGKVITARYDKNIKELGKFLLEDFDKVEEFVIDEWGKMLPGKMYFNLVDAIGPSPFNPFLKDAYFKAGHFYKSDFIKEYFCSTIVHEIGHYVEFNYLNLSSFQITQKGISSFKFIDEGYQEWKRTEYLNKHSEYGIFTDNCAFHMLTSGFFPLKDLIKKWIKTMFDYLNFPIYATATSFTYFLEKKIGYEKINNIFKSMPNYDNAKNWNDYLKLYFKKDLLELMQAWKQKIIENKGSAKSKKKTIITFLEVTETREKEIILHYKANYPLWAGHNIFIYDDKQNLLSINKVEKYRFLKEGNLKVKISNPEQLKIYVYFFEFEQEISFDIKAMKMDI